MKDEVQSSDKMSSGRYGNHHKEIFNVEEDEESKRSFVLEENSDQNLYGVENKYVCR